MGSVIRPASYCGVLGFKPSFGAVPRAGLMKLAPQLDTVGWFANYAEDLELVWRCLLQWQRARTQVCSCPARKPDQWSTIARTRTPGLFDLTRKNSPESLDYFYLRVPSCRALHGGRCGAPTCGPSLRGACVAVPTYCVCMQLHRNQQVWHVFCAMPLMGCSLPPVQLASHHVVTSYQC